MPGVALPLGLTVNVELLLPGTGALTGLGLKLVLILFALLMLRLTELEELTPDTITLVVLLDPRDTLIEFGLAEMLKSGFGPGGGGGGAAAIVNEPIAVFQASLQKKLELLL